MAANPRALIVGSGVSGLLLLACWGAFQEGGFSFADGESWRWDGRKTLVSGRLGAGRIKEIFDQVGYDLEAVRSGYRPVPRVTAAAMPADLAALPDTDERKALFLSLVLPAVLHVNETILEDRARLEKLRAFERAGRRIAPMDRKWLHALAARYDTAPEPAALLARTDIVPPSLALAQAAIESGWGTSRFAREGNALFGQRVYGEGGGIVPALLRAPAFRVRAFDDIVAAVDAYALNLNSNAAHAAFRKRRAQLRWKGQPLDGDALAATLTAYSERGADYTAQVLAVIRANALDDFDAVRLAGPRAVVRPSPPLGEEARVSPAAFRAARAETE